MQGSYLLSWKFFCFVFQTCDLGHVAIFKNRSISFFWGSILTEEISYMLDKHLGLADLPVRKIGMFLSRALDTVIPVIFLLFFLAIFSTWATLSLKLQSFRSQAKAICFIDVTQSILDNIVGKIVSSQDTVISFVIF